MKCAPGSGSLRVIRPAGGAAGQPVWIIRQEEGDGIGNALYYRGAWSMLITRLISRSRDTPLTAKQSLHAAGRRNPAVPDSL